MYCGLLKLTKEFELRLPFKNESKIDISKPITKELYTEIII